ncbi:hypothetical protein [uncultured Fibrobacter sp.]|uniref:hypothetical protein n=1 Tax=uncultured Fibrobacter sp. TaxID=261512 RepID=UPI0025E20FF5|nr:hypothetical protein [uncultured Fibrobacter sp.]
MSTYTIQCYIETLSSDNKVTLRGCDGYKLLKDEKKYLVFFESALKCTLIEELKELSLTNLDDQKQKMLLMAHVSRKKVELDVNLKTKNKTIEITKIKLLQ